MTALQCMQEQATATLSSPDGTSSALPARPPALPPATASPAAQASPAALLASPARTHLPANSTGASPTSRNQHHIRTDSPARQPGRAPTAIPTSSKQLSPAVVLRSPFASAAPPSPMALGPPDIPSRPLLPPPGPSMGPSASCPSSQPVQLSYQWGSQSCVSGMLDLVMWSWDTRRGGTLWHDSGDIHSTCFAHCQPVPAIGCSHNKPLHSLPFQTQGRQALRCPATKHCCLLQHTSSKLLQELIIDMQLGPWTNTKCCCQHVLLCRSRRACNLHVQCTAELDKSSVSTSAWFVIGLRAEESVLQPSLFLHKLRPEEGLAQSPWLNRRKEKWDGKLLVFTLPQHLADGDNLAAVHAQLSLTRLTSMLRYGNEAHCTGPFWLTNL